MWMLRCWVLVHFGHVVFDIVEVIHGVINGFSQIWLQAKCESKFFKTSIYIFGYILEPCIEIWRFLYILVSFWLLKISKNHRISALIRWQACTI
jgi:hypothetical protein